MYNKSRNKKQIGENMTEKKLIIAATILTVAVAAAFIGNSYVSAKNIPAPKQVGVINADSNKAIEILSHIDKYQEEYFTIIKRNNVMLNFDDGEDLKADRKELKKLFSTVKKQVKNKEYLKEYKKIEKQYAKCDEITTTGINEFAENNYNAVKNLYNEVYKKVESKLTPEDFKKLSASEKKWQKEVDAYKKVYDSLEFGTIGLSTYYDYQTSMISFRTLLLMLYL